LVRFRPAIPAPNGVPPTRCLRRSRSLRFLFDATRRRPAVRYALRCCLLLPFLAPLALADEAPERALFDGKTLNGWVVEGQKTYKDGDKEKPVWEAKDGMISCVTDKGGYGFLRYEKQKFGDFRLTLEYRFARPSDPK